MRYRTFWFYSHVNYSVTKIALIMALFMMMFYSHVNYSVTKMVGIIGIATGFVLQSRKLFSY